MCIRDRLDADYLIILTAVEKAAINFGKPEQKWLDTISSCLLYTSRCV